MFAFISAAVTTKTKHANREKKNEWKSIQNVEHKRREEKIALENIVYVYCHQNCD